MFAIIGMLVVIGAVLGGYLMEHGEIKVLLQPAELVIIGGAALGTLFIANPISIVIRIFKGLITVLKGSPYTKASYLETLKMMNEMFMMARKQGMFLRLEEDIENPEKSQEKALQISQVSAQPSRGGVARSVNIHPAIHPAFAVWQKCVAYADCRLSADPRCDIDPLHERLDRAALRIERKYFSLAFC